MASTATTEIKLLRRNLYFLNKEHHQNRKRLFKMLCNFIFEKEGYILASTRLSDFYKIHKNKNIKSQIKACNGPKAFIEKCTDLIFKKDGLEYKLIWAPRNGNKYGSNNLKLTKIGTIEDFSTLKSEIDIIKEKLGMGIE